MPATWDDAQNKALFLAVVAVACPNVTGAQWAEIAKIMGPGYTASGLSQHFAKLKRTISNKADNKVPSSPAAPRKAKRAGSAQKSAHTGTEQPSTTTPKSAPGKGAKRGVDDDEIEDQDANEWHRVHEAKKTKIELDSEDEDVKGVFEF